ncbi:MAG: DUF4212 domain-containing protein [Gammaproteobacteria bacterium]|nr:DUF4212 domain-containing protein [Gammaproteobacteria bacterium]
MSVQNGKNAEYWKANIKLLATLLAIWFIVSYGCGILFKEALDNIQFFGWGLGFWFAQQGSIYVFIALIVIYTVQMNKLDRKFDFHEED